MFWTNNSKEALTFARTRLRILFSEIVSLGWLMMLRERERGGESLGILYGCNFYGDYDPFTIISQLTYPTPIDRPFPIHLSAIAAATSLITWKEEFVLGCQSPPL